MARDRQLSLLSAPRARPAPRLARAKRDLSATEFAAALAREGFQLVESGYRIVDLSGATTGFFEPVTRRNPVRIAHRATLSKILRERDREQRQNRPSESRQNR